MHCNLMNSIEGWQRKERWCRRNAKRLGEKEKERKGGERRRSRVVHRITDGYPVIANKWNQLFTHTPFAKTINFKRCRFYVIVGLFSCCFYSFSYLMFRHHFSNSWWTREKMCALIKMFSAFNYRFDQCGSYLSLLSIPVLNQMIIFERCTVAIAAAAAAAAVSAISVSVHMS